MDQPGDAPPDGAVPPDEEPPPEDEPPPPELPEPGLAPPLESEEELVEEGVGAGGVVLVGTGTAEPVLPPGTVRTGSVVFEAELLPPQELMPTAATAPAVMVAVRRANRLARFPSPGIRKSRRPYVGCRWGKCSSHVEPSVHSGCRGAELQPTKEVGMRLVQVEGQLRLGSVSRLFLSRCKTCQPQPQ